MMYIGCARNSNEVDRALKLAATSFRSKESIEEAMDAKSFLMFPYGAVSQDNVIVIADGLGEVLGTCFMIERRFYWGRTKVKGTFLSSICIAASCRGQGLSKLLMNYAIEVCERRGSAFAILIARRAVDYFYNKFSFWGLSQYSQIKINFKNISVPSTRYQLCPAIERDLSIINYLYESTYSSLHGSCERSIEYWKYVLSRTQKQNINFTVFKNQNAICGYAIFSGSEIFELASTTEDSCIDFLHYLNEILQLDTIIFNSSPEHRIAHELQSLDFSITQRQCNFGGHMVRVIDHGLLLHLLKNELREWAGKLGAKNYSEITTNAAIEIDESELNITLKTSPFDYENTCFLLRVSCLSKKHSNFTIFTPSPFNVLLGDQI